MGSRLYAAPAVRGSALCKDLTSFACTLQVQLMLLFIAATQQRDNRMERNTESILNIELSFDIFLHNKHEFRTINVINTFYWQIFLSKNHFHIQLLFLNLLEPVPQNLLQLQNL